MGASLRLPAATAAAALGGIACALALESGGYFPRAWVWSSVVLLWLAAVALVTRPTVASRERVCFVAAAAACAAWAVLSSVWSTVPAQSVLDARRDLVYVGGAVATLAAVGRLGASFIPSGILAATTATAAVGIGRYLVSGPVDRAEASLLSWPVGYANAFAALAAMSLPIAVALAAHGRRGATRSSAAASVPLLIGVLQLTSSRGGTLAAAAAVVALGALDPRRRALRHTAVRLLPAAGVIVVALAWADLAATKAAPLSHRVVVAVAFVASAVAAAVAVRGMRRAPRGGEITRRAVAGVAAAAVVVAATVSVLPALGADGAARHAVGAQRAAYWDFAWRVIPQHPLLGSGAGAFGRAWIEHGPFAAYGGALDVHNLYLETLAELGPVGLVLLLVFLGLPLTQARAAARASRIGSAAAAAYVAFLVHAAVDWDWEMPAVALPAVLIGGALLALADRQPRSRPLSSRARAGLAAAAVALALTALIGLRSDALPAAAGQVSSEHSEGKPPQAASFL